VTLTGVHRFSATTTSEAVVAAPREDIWAAITDPNVLPKLTPLLRHIEAEDDLWRWDLARINILGIVVDPSFTERMSFVPDERIEYTHEPPAGAHEWASAEGWYQLTDHQAGTHLAISITLSVELPLARLMAPAVETVIRTSMAVTGSRFASNLDQHLGISSGTPPV
jgi:carbon monoxide dehydrogenase subunit G